MIQLALENSRTLLTGQITIWPITGIDALLHAEEAYACAVTSIEGYSQELKIAGANVIVLDSTQTHWVTALSTAMDWGGRWPLYILEQYFILKLNMAGLGGEADIFNRFIAESRTGLGPLKDVDPVDTDKQNRLVERLILGHELGHLAFAAASRIDSNLLTMVRRSVAEIGKIFAAALDYKMEDLDLSVEEEDALFVSVEQYLNRYLFTEFPGDTYSIQRELIRKADIWSMTQRMRRLEPLRAAFGTIDLLQECFCDIYGFERLLLQTGATESHAHFLCLDVVRILHCSFAFGAIDSLVRERMVKAQMRQELRALYAPLSAQQVEAMDEEQIKAVSEQAEAIKLRFSEDPERLEYQKSMIRAIYRRVAFHTYVRDRPAIGLPTTLAEMGRLGDRLEANLFGACARIRGAADFLDPQLPKLLEEDCAPLEQGELRDGWRSLSQTLPKVGFVAMRLVEL
ncbi:hypothetical protein ACCC88_13120 [Sphingomonas sp. Sphisp140]|uniref:hypothetical protein n=1 Tax=unclassified Sphingomonas TaxID=196159 RepID=UPI0039AFB5EA